MASKSNVSWWTLLVHYSTWVPNILVPILLLGAWVALGGCSFIRTLRVWAIYGLHKNGYFIGWVPKNLAMMGNFGHITSRSHFFIPLIFFSWRKVRFFSILSWVCLMYWKRSRHDGFLLCFTWTSDCSLNLDLQVI